MALKAYNSIDHFYSALSELAGTFLYGKVLDEDISKSSFCVPLKKASCIFEGIFVFE